MPRTTYTLKAEKRTITGKKVKKLRKEGILPANIYGQNIKSQTIQVNTKDFISVYQKAGETSIVELTVKGEKKPHHVLIHHPQLHPVSDEYLHVDFHEVALKSKVKVDIPIVLKGTSEAAEKKLGVLIQLENSLEVEALPTELPDEIVVDISQLSNVGDEIKVSDLPASKSYTFTNDPDTCIVRINPIEKEEEPAVQPEEEKEETEGEKEEKKEDKKEETPSSEENKSEENKKEQEKENKS